jgi:hypothetical protein
MADIKWDDRVLYVWMNDLTGEVTHIYGQRAETELHPLIPVLSPRVKPPGEGWSPRGNLMRSWRVNYELGLDGVSRSMVIILDRVFRFTKKHQHAIRDPLTPWIKSQIGRPIQ